MTLVAYVLLVITCIIIALYWYLTNKRRPK